MKHEQWLWKYYKMRKIYISHVILKGEKPARKEHITISRVKIEKKKKLTAKKMWEVQLEVESFFVCCFF